jgi:hypothetical protein
MSSMIEVIYHSPHDPVRENRITTTIISFGGRLTYREEVAIDSLVRSVCLTYEFAVSDSAASAANQLRNLNEHVEGPMDYGYD